MRTIPTPGVRAPVHPGRRAANPSPLAARPPHPDRWLTAAAWAGVTAIGAAVILTGATDHPVTMFGAFSLVSFLRGALEPPPQREHPPTRLHSITDYMPAWWYLP